MKRTRPVLVRACAVGAIASAFLLLVAATASAQTTVSGTVFTLNCPGLPATAATDINDSGVVVGRCGTPSTGVWHGFVYTKGTDYSDGSYEVFDVPFAGALSTEAWGINNKGDIVGFYTGGDGFAHGFVRHASGGYDKIDRAGALNTMPEDINDAGYVVGCMHNTGLMMGFVWKDGQFLSISTSYNMFTGINESGTAIGFEFTPPSGNQSFVVSGVDRLEFSYLGTANTQAWGLNQAGDIVGWYAVNNSTRGFLRGHDGTMASVDVPGAAFTRPLGINEAGTIVGVKGPGTHGFVLVQQ